jgi:erythromycin esterase
LFKSKNKNIMKPLFLSALFSLFTGFVFTQTLVKNPIPFHQAQDLDLLIEKMAAKKMVLLGESTHGTHQFYTWRDSITRRLIQEHRFNFIAVEGDFATIYLLNRYVKGIDTLSTSAVEILQGFNRFPTWMWANHETARMVEWLRDYNQQLPKNQQVGIYGIDLYDEWRSYNEVITLVKKYSPHLYTTLSRYYNCWRPYYGDSWNYALDVNNGTQRSCEEDHLHALELILDSFQTQASDHPLFFYLLQNALVVSNAEKFYREEISYPNSPKSWNTRVFHFYQTLLNLVALYGPDSKGIVWAHNTHIGDATYSAMNQQQQQNIGQLLRAEWGEDQVFLVGFTTYQGEVLAAKSWSGKRKTLKIPPAQKHSLEYLLHQQGIPQFYLIFEPQDPPQHLLGNRAIGVVYRPQSDYLHYVPSWVPKRYDALFYFYNTTPLQVIHP